jgi:hypothetical protein
MGAAHPEQPSTYFRTDLVDGSDSSLSCLRSTGVTAFMPHSLAISGAVLRVVFAPRRAVSNRNRGLPRSAGASSEHLHGAGCVGRYTRRAALDRGAT